MMDFPICPVCASTQTYSDSVLYICPDCTHEWAMNIRVDTADVETRTVKDANGNPLADGDAVILIKDLKVKGSSLVIKKGTKVKSIRIIEGDHDIDCKVEGVALQLKSTFLKKA